MAFKKPALSPFISLMDDGSQIDTQTASGQGIMNAGIEQNRLRRNQIMDQNSQHQTGFGPLKGLMSGLGLGGSPSWDGFFGAMQMRENTAADNGKRFNVGWRGFGQRPDPNSTTWQEGQQAIDPRLRGFVMRGKR